MALIFLPKMKGEKGMNKFTTKLRHSSPVILTCLSVAGMIGTTVMAVRATPKALQLVKIKKDELQTEELEPVELIRTTWRCYIPTGIIGLSTIACIVGIGVVSKRNQAALASAYAMLNETYKQYRNAAKAVYGEDADKKIHTEMAKDANISDGAWGMQTYNMDMDPENERLLFYDLISKRYFNTTMAAVINAQYHINRNLQLRGYCTLNEYYEFLGLDGVKNGDEIGWDLTELYIGGEQWLDFDNQKTILDDGMECILLSTDTPNKIEGLS